MQKGKYSVKRRFGNKGEDLACMFLMKHGHRIIYRNYLKRVGEIDIVSLKNNVFHFTEVKTVSRETGNCVTHEIFGHRPEENIDRRKMLHMKRVIDVFLSEKRIYNREIQINVATVLFDTRRRVWKVGMIENVILG